MSVCSDMHPIVSLRFSVKGFTYIVALIKPSGFIENPSVILSDFSGMPTAKCGMKPDKCGMLTVGCGMTSVDCGILSYFCGMKSVGVEI